MCVSVCCVCVVWNSSVPLSYKIPAADQDVDDLTLGEMLTEAYRQVMSPSPMTSTRPQSSLTCSSWTRRRFSPTKSLLRTHTTVTLHSKTCSIKYIERKPITLYERTCLSVCLRRQCPIEQGDLLEIDRGDSVRTEAQKHRLGLCSIIKKSRFLQNAKQELINTSFKQLEPKESNDFFKDNNCSKFWNFVKLIKEVSLKWKN